MLIGPSFEDSELMYPYFRLQEAGYEVDLVGPEADTKYTGKHGVSFTSDKAAKKTKVNDYDMIVIPGGQQPDKLRTNNDVVQLVKDAFDKGLLAAVICHGPQLLIEADVVRGRRMTSWPSVRTDLKNAGATVVDEEVVVDGNLVTSRKPSDLPAWMRETLRVAEKQVVTA